MPALRLCLLTDCYPPSIGGIEHHVYGLASHLGQEGRRVDVVTHQAIPRPIVQQGRNVALPELPASVVVYRLEGLVARIRGADPLVDPRIVSRVQNLLAANCYDVVHGHSTSSILVLAGLRAARRSGIPTVITKHSMMMRPTWPSIVNHLLSVGEQQVLRRWVNGIIAVSEAAAKELSAIDLPKYVIPGGVDCQHWHPNPVTRQRIRNFLGYQEDNIVVGALSRMVPYKGWMGLPRIVARIVRLLPNVRFLAIGDGPLRMQLERQVRELNLEDVVMTLGVIPWWETPNYINAMDVFVFPSYTEACGLALLEAMACAKASIARVNEGSREAIIDGETGYLIASDEELFQRLIMLAEDKGLRDRVGINARRYIQDRHSWQVVTNRVVEAYEEAICRR